MQIVSFSRFGYTGEIVKVEADLRRGIPTVDIVGLPDGAVKEARERMRAAIRNSGLEYPKERILINLSPADLKKEGSSFDLPIALAVLTTNDEDCFKGYNQTIMALGELELSGNVRKVKGVLAAVSSGIENKIQHFIVPKENLKEALNCKGAIVHGVENLCEALHCLHTLEIPKDEPPLNPKKCEPYTATWSNQTISNNTLTSNNPTKIPNQNLKTNELQEVLATEIGDISDIKGQAVLVRSLEIAAAGGHNLIAYGPPGCGKTLALSRFPQLLPDLDQATSFDVTRIYSIAGLLNPLENQNGQSTNGMPASLNQIKRPPFRQPHTSASLEGMIGGGKYGSPGEISLSHGGVLFLDEAAQFKTSVLQSLRTPLETGIVTVTRANRTSIFPSRFQLLMAVNPCPCGNFANPGQVCTCMPESIAAYWRRIAFPLLDRVDMRVEVMPGKKSDLVKPSNVSTKDLRKTIKQARETQWDRNRKVNLQWLNSSINANHLEIFCKMDNKTTKIFTEVLEKAKISNRGAHSILRIARTIADLEGVKSVSEEHILEATYFRKWSKYVPDFLVS